MAIVDLTGHLLTLDYDKLYLVSSNLSKEARDTHQFRFDGVVGELTPSDEQPGGLKTGSLETDGPETGGLETDGPETSSPETSGPETSGPQGGDRETLDRQRWTLKSSKLWLISITALLGGIPIAVIGGMTRFQPEDNTRLQQFFTMAWLGCGIFIEGLMPFYRIDTYSLVYVLLRMHAGMLGMLGKHEAKSRLWETHKD